MGDDSNWSDEWNLFAFRKKRSNVETIVQDLDVFRSYRIQVSELTNVLGL